MNNFPFFSIFFFFLFFSGHSQTSDSSGNPIDTKFTELIETSNSFKGYKVVDFEKLTALQNSTSTYIRDLKAEISASEESIASQNTVIQGLEEDLKQIQAQLDEVSAQKDAITFLGMPFSKSAYKTIMWALVGILILALALFVYRYKKGHFTTREARKRLTETEKEFEAFRAKSLEKEQRLGRLLQDERNKLLNLTK